MTITVKVVLIVVTILVLVPVLWAIFGAFLLPH